jgi:aldehyde:ferredoxin oxidoreductase
MLAVLMDAGLAEFGDVNFLGEALKEIRLGTENGRLWAQGTARVGEHYQVNRVPTVKKQAISAYDPRVIEVTGVTMMVTAQGADHTAGNLPKIKSRDKEIDEIMDASLEVQVEAAVNDSLGLCIFGRFVSTPNVEFIVNAINNAHGTNVEPSFLENMGRETLRMEREFNRAAGFTIEDDELPEFFYTEPLYPSNQVARFHSEDVKDIYDRLESKAAAPS